MIIKSQRRVQVSLLVSGKLGIHPQVCPAPNYWPSFTFSLSSNSPSHGSKDKTLSWFPSTFASCRFSSSFTDSPSLALTQVLLLPRILFSALNVSSPHSLLGLLHPLPWFQLWKDYVWCLPDLCLWPRLLPDCLQGPSVGCVRHFEFSKPKTNCHRIPNISSSSWRLCLSGCRPKHPLSYKVNNLGVNKDSSLFLIYHLQILMKSYWSNLLNVSWTYVSLFHSPGFCSVEAFITRCSFSRLLPPLLLWFCCLSILPSL